MNNNTESKYLGLADIKVDPACQARAAMDDPTIDEYVEIMKEETDDPFPPVVVYYDGTEYWLSDGFHRRAAAEKVGLRSLKVEIRQGHRRDAILNAVGANATHGLPRSNDDKRRSVAMLLKDPEWVRWSDAKIAHHCRVSDRFVAKQRKNTPNRSESAARVYIHPKSGKPTKMNTAKIGKKDDLEQLLSIDPGPDKVPDHGWLVTPNIPAGDNIITEDTGDELTPLVGANSSDEVQLGELMSAWSRASEEVQQQFLVKIGVFLDQPQVEAAAPMEPELPPASNTSAMELPPSNPLFEMWKTFKRVTRADGLRWVADSCPGVYHDSHFKVTESLAPFRQAARVATPQQWAEFLERARAYEVY